MLQNQCQQTLLFKIIFRVHFPKTPVFSNKCYSSIYIKILYLSGGTVDITVHEVKRDGTLEELDHASGGAWGGTYVDQSFREMLEDIVSKGTLEGFAKAHTADYIEMFRDFETKKRNVPEDPSGKITVKLPISLVEFFEGDDEENEGAFKNAISGSRYKNKVVFVKDKIRITNEAFKAFFQNAGDGIVKHVKDLLRSPKVRGTNTILMVGGFSESSLLQNIVRKEFPQCRVIIPQEAGLSVLKGAVIFGHKPKTIVGRVAKCTYGVKVSELFKEGVHKPEKKFQAEGEDRCKDIFSKHVTKGDALKVDQIQSQSDYFPVYRNQKTIAFAVHTSSKNTPQYTDEHECKYIGTMNVTLQNPSKGSEGVECQMIFGGTELQLVCIEKSTKNRTTANFDFLDKSSS